jgi:acetyl esterase/lipase
MRRALLAGALFSCAPLFAQSSGIPDLPRLMNPRSVMSLPAAAPGETISYGEAPSQKVELFLPAPNAEAPDALRPVVVLIHGGCWQASVAGIDLVRPAAGAFLEKGFAVWSITYRRIDEEGGGYPGTFQDVGAAIDALRDQAEAKKLDLNRVVLWGHSAGGHLALWAAGRHKLPADRPFGGRVRFSGAVGNRDPHHLRRRHGAEAGAADDGRWRRAQRRPALCRHQPRPAAADRGSGGDAARRVRLCCLPGDGAGPCAGWPQGG